MDEPPQSRAPTDSQSLTDRQVDGLLLSSKKIRYRNRKACYPCNKRKIKCDRDEQPNGQPCSNCRKRPHPELCSYEDSNPRSSGGSTRSALHSSQPATPSQHAFQQAATPVQGQPMLSGIHAASTAYNVDRFRPHEHEHAASYSPYYGDNSASYSTTPYSANASASPFASQGLATQANSQPARNDMNVPTRATPSGFAQAASSAAHTVYRPRPSTNLKDEISLLLPAQKHILPYFGIYRTLCAPLNPIILDLDDFEANVCNQVIGLANGQLVHRIISSSGQSQELALTQLALLLATLASGLQYSDLPQAERSQLLQEYARKSFHCLGLANFILRPSFISIQTLLLLAAILQNDFEPEAAWAVLNTTRGLAQALGLDTNTRSAGNGSRDSGPGLEIQSAVTWQETYLAMCFGRRPIGLVPNSGPLTKSTSENLDYKECLIALSENIAASYNQLQSQNDIASTFTRLDQRVLPRLHSQDHCRSIQSRMEYFAFRIQSNFVSTSLQLRSAQFKSAHTHEERKLGVEKCRESCSHTLRAFLDMQTFTIIPLRTWTFMHNALASAILLGILDGQGDADIRTLQRSLVDILVRSQQEGVTPQNFSRYFSVALDEVEKMVSRPHQSEQEGPHNGEADTEMSDSLPPSNTGNSADGSVLDLAQVWQKYFSVVFPTDSTAGIELPQQSAWGL